MLPAIATLTRYRGCLLGLAAGDALGTSIEFQPPGTFEPITDMLGGGPFHLSPGEWTDDTSMALCLAKSLIERRGFDPIDQLERYLLCWQPIWATMQIPPPPSMANLPAPIMVNRASQPSGWQNSPCAKKSKKLLSGSIFWDGRQR